jgi:hypothetical protein
LNIAPVQTPRGRGEFDTEFVFRGLICLKPAAWLGNNMNLSGLSAGVPHLLCAKGGHSPVNSCRCCGFHPGGVGVKVSQQTPEASMELFDNPEAKADEIARIAWRVLRYE